ncbi:hypothetical protein [Nocardia thraciensis]
MPGQHRKPATGRSPNLPTVGAIAVVAVVVAIVWIVTRPSSAAEDAAAIESLSAVGAHSSPAPAPPQARVAPALPAAAGDGPLLAKQARQYSLCPTELAGTRPHVAQVGHLIGKTFAVAEIGGAEGRGNDDHGAGLALDFMIADAAQGDAIADFVLADKERLGVNYVIWRQRHNDGGGWSVMEDRGGSTANHYDHVHVSFDPAAAVNLIC